MKMIRREDHKTEAIKKKHAIPIHHCTNCDTSSKVP
jgi:hypothetical protein